MTSEPEPKSEPEYDPLVRDQPCHPWGEPEYTSTIYGMSAKYPFKGFITRNRMLIYYEVSFVRREIDKLQDPDLKAKDTQRHVAILDEELDRLVKTIERVLIELGDVDPSHEWHAENDAKEAKLPKPRVVRTQEYVKPKRRRKKKSEAPNG